MLQSIMNGSSTKERKARLLESISNLDHFESAMLHRMVQYLAAYKVIRHLISFIQTSENPKLHQDFGFFLPNF